MKSLSPSPSYRKRFSFTWRQVIYLALLALIGWYVVDNRGELSQVLVEVWHGIWYWLLLALMLQVIHFACHALATKAAFQSLAMNRRGRELLPVTLAMMTVNVVAHAMNLSGLLYLVDEAKRRGYNAAGSFLAALVVVYIDGLAIVTFALATVGTYLILGKANLGIAIGAGVITIIVAFFVILTLYFWRYPERLSKWLRIFGKRRAEVWMKEWYEVVKLRPGYRKMWKVYFWTVLSHATSWLSLVAVFLALGIGTNFLDSAVAYIVSVISLILSPTPMGIGFVEGAMTGALLGQGLGLAAATAVMLVFRGISFWLPFLIGALLLHRFQATYPKTHAE